MKAISIASLPRALSRALSRLLSFFLCCSLALSEARSLLIKVYSDIIRFYNERWGFPTAEEWEWEGEGEGERERERESEGKRDQRGKEQKSERLSEGPVP